MSESPTTEIDRSEVQYVSKQHWLYEETDYVLGYIPSECNKCGDGGLDEVCFWCGNEVTGFAD